LTNGKAYEFEAQLKQHAGMDAAYIEFPYDVETEYGTKGQVKVKAFFDGAEYRGSLARMGLACHCLGVTKAIRKQIGKAPGDRVAVRLWMDEEPRLTEPAEDVLMALEEAGRLTAFHSLSYTRRKEYLNAIEASKRPATRQQLIQRLLEALGENAGDAGDG
jgi:hypothetical protein